MRDPVVVTSIDRQFDDSGTPLQEALFSNTNDGLSLEAEGPSLVGRTASLHGPASAVEAELPLAIISVVHGELVLDLDELISALPFFRTADFSASFAAALSSATIDCGSF